MTNQLCLKGQVRIKQEFPETMARKIFETNAGFHV